MLRGSPLRLAKLLSYLFLSRPITLSGPNLLLTAKTVL